MRDAEREPPSRTVNEPKAWGSYFAAETRRETVRDLTFDLDLARRSLRWIAVLMLFMGALGYVVAADHYGPAVRQLQALAPDAPATVDGRPGTAGELLADSRLAILFAWLAPLLQAAWFEWLRWRSRRAPRRAFDEAIVTFVGVHVSAAIWAPMTLMPPQLLLARIGLLFALVGGRIAAVARERMTSAGSA